LERFYQERSGQPKLLKQIAALAQNPGADPHADATIDRLVERFGQAVSYVLNIFDPHALVIGGGVGNIDALYTQRARDCIRAHIFNDDCKTALLKPTLGDSAGVFGAALTTQFLQRENYFDPDIKQSIDEKFSARYFHYAI
jgi:fructokinase